MIPTVEVSSVAPGKQAHHRAALQGGLQPAFIQALKKKEILPGEYNSINYSYVCSFAPLKLQM